MLFETNVLPYKLEVANGLQWRTSFILLACAFVAALILGAVLHDKQARHWAEKLERASCNSYDPAAGQLDPAFSAFLFSLPTLSFQVFALIFF